MSAKYYIYLFVIFFNFTAFSINTERNQLIIGSNDSYIEDDASNKTQKRLFAPKELIDNIEKENEYYSFLTASYWKYWNEEKKTNGKTFNIYKYRMQLESQFAVAYSVYDRIGKVYIVRRSLYSNDFSIFKEKLVNDITFEKMFYKVFGTNLCHLVVGAAIAIVAHNSGLSYSIPDRLSFYQHLFKIHFLHCLFLTLYESTFFQEKETFYKSISEEEYLKARENVEYHKFDSKERILEMFPFEEDKTNRHLLLSLCIGLATVLFNVGIQKF